MTALTTSHDRETLHDEYQRVRNDTERLAAPLSAEDQVVQSMPDVSPTKWHRAHTTWFFETFLLSPDLPGYAPFDPSYGFLFNSYYEAVGPRHPRPQRGVLSRPSVDDIARYRASVDGAMHDYIDMCSEEAAALIELGLHHEQQHQELLLMDIKHVLSCNSMDPVYSPDRPLQQRRAAPRFVEVAGGDVEIGNNGENFGFDNEGPLHTVLLEPFRIHDGLVTAGEWLAFIADDGYRRPELWLADGWHTVQELGWEAPLYWRNDGDDGWTVFTLAGRRALDAQEPVVHVSHYEADAFANWCGLRLPTEFEWEHAAVSTAPGTLTGLDDTAWQWTGSAYLPYPRFRPAAGAVGEYNGKFMSGQMTLRGGSRVTPVGHSRPTYRNFFPPGSRWMYGGVRLAGDVRVSTLEDNAHAGLTSTPKDIPPKWFYDDRGSALFDEITRLDEYYPTRCERAILEARGAEIAAASGADTLVELGSGTSEKTRVLLDALRTAGTLRRFIPFDVSKQTLHDAATAIEAEYPGVHVEPVVGDFTLDLHTIPMDGRCMVAFLGGTIGNFMPHDRAAFLRSISDLLEPDDTFLLGTDLVKDVARLEAAYDDARGVTSEFNKNVLHVMNRELDADFDVDAFDHVAAFDAANEWIEMRLRSAPRDQTVHVGALQLDVPFTAGEEMRTEVSAKFRREGIEQELEAAGLQLTHWWTDPANDFALSLSVRL